MEHAIDAILEIFSWIGFGAGILLAVVAVLMRLVDGTWVPTRALIEDADGGRVARWFDANGGVGQARLTPEQEKRIAGADSADVYCRVGGQPRMRLTHGSPAVRAVGLLAAALVALGLVASVISWVLLFVRG